MGWHVTQDRWFILLHALQWGAIVVLFARVGRVESLVRGLFTRWGGRKGGG